MHSSISCYLLLIQNEHQGGCWSMLKPAWEKKKSSKNSTLQTFLYTHMYFNCYALHSLKWWCYMLKEKYSIWSWSTHTVGVLSGGAGASRLKASGIVSESILSPLINLQLHKTWFSRLFTRVRFSLHPDQNNGITVKKHNAIKWTKSIDEFRWWFFYPDKQLFDSLETPLNRWQIEGNHEELTCAALHWRN